MCVTFVGLCLLKEPLLCSCCWTATHLEMLMVSLTTLLSCVWQGYLHVLVISLKISPLYTIRVLYYPATPDWSLLLNMSVVITCDELPEKWVIATLTISTSLGHSDNWSNIWETPWPQSDEICPIWPPLKGETLQDLLGHCWEGDF